MKFLAPFVFLLGRSMATLTLTQEEIDQDNFFGCLLNMEYADTDGDNRLSQDEAVAFIDGASQGMYGKSVSVDGALPDSMAGLYDTLVDLSEPLAGEVKIDVYGCRHEDVSIRTLLLHEQGFNTRVLNLVCALLSCIAAFVVLPHRFRL
jgi:hypothetical protein